MRLDSVAWENDEVWHLVIIHSILCLVVTVVTNLKVFFFTKFTWSLTESFQVYYLRFNFELFRNYQTMEGRWSKKSLSSSYILKAYVLVCILDIKIHPYYWFVLLTTLATLVSNFIMTNPVSLLLKLTMLG